MRQVVMHDSSIGTVDATKARDRMNPVSLKVTKFSNKSSRDFQKIPSFSVLSFCDYHCTLKRNLVSFVATTVLTSSSAFASQAKANPSCCPLRPRTTPFPEEKSILGVIYGVLLWADMNAATPLGAWGRSVISLAPRQTQAGRGLSTSSMRLKSRRLH